MAFKQITPLGASFNSDLSCNFKSLLDKAILDSYKKKESHKPSKTIAPSSLRCERLTYFRLRGVDPDEEISVDRGLEFSAFIGSSCHEMLQKQLFTGDFGWINIPLFLSKHKINHEYDLVEHELETLIKFKDIPVNLSVDGILEFGENNFYLLEIKSCEPSSFKTLSKPKESHVDQIKCYCAMLELNNVMMIYIDRMYGDIKCFEVKFTDYQLEEVFSKINKIQDFVKSNVAPPRLSYDDFWCTNCKYKKRCKQWG